MCTNVTLFLTFQSSVIAVMLYTPVLYDELRMLSSTWPLAVTLHLRCYLQWIFLTPGLIGNNVTLHTFSVFRLQCVQLSVGYNGSSLTKNRCSFFVYK